ncbi:hypothetical protein C8J56DRAFT_883934 [Mycena floridula]|nr:hypothetical protein C8J56DRAFT_883934 [Mycena floridula]
MSVIDQNLVAGILHRNAPMSDSPEPPMPGSIVNVVNDEKLVPENGPNIVVGGLDNQAILISSKSARRPTTFGDGEIRARVRASLRQKDIWDFSVSVALLWCIHCFLLPLGLPYKQPGMADA